MAFQIGSSMLDALVLGIVNKESTYGYVLTQQAKQLMDISDSTLYPVLKRLLKDDALYTYDVPFQGRNRRYYSITDKGKQMLESYITDWHSYKELVEQLLTGGISATEGATAKNNTAQIAKSESDKEEKTKEEKTKEEGNKNEEGDKI